MQAHTVERVESWDSRPFSGGFRELHELADAEFSGAVVADDAWLFMLNGRVIGVFEGDVEDFGDASGTVYEAPHPSLALLFSMQERGGETQAKYYTNDTPLSEAAQTLEDASFTGYIELSENVLSGDYYVVYYGGRSMSAAFVGASEELITGDEAFERADDEVGVYEVKKSPVNVTSLPAAEDDDTGGGAGATGATAVSEEPDESGADEREETPEPDHEESETTTEEPESDTRETEPSDSQPSTAASESDEASAEGRQSPTSETETTPDAGGASTDTEASPEPRTGASAPRDETRSDEPSGADAGRSEANAADASDAAADAPQAGDEGVFDQEEEWRNAKSVPTLDPEKSESTDGGATKSQPSQAERSKPESSTQRPSKGQSSKSSASASKSGSGGKRRSTVEKLKRAVQQRDAKLEEAAERIDSLEGERDELRERVETLEAERDELRERANELETELEAAVEAGGGEATPANDLTPAAALSGTNLFVRYGSKGKSTLDDLGLETDFDAVNENLRIDHHTQFEADHATVDGEEYESFLEATASYRFVSWAVRELPFEIRDAGHTDGLGDLYDALPEVDRAELDGTVEVETEEGSASRTFDVVLRDRMGDPLVVAELNAEREPVTGEEMGALVDDATAVCEGVDELSAAMYVTASFFEPAALETASEQTGGGGFLSRNDKESFVRVGRKSGYHLCLIEDRNDAFHLTVPEL